MPTTVLIADDSMFQRFQTAKAVREAGYEVVEAKNGEECLAKAHEHHPRALLLDLNMPDPGGLAVMEVLARELPDIAIIVVTADIQDTTRNRCLELGARSFLNKPINATGLISALETVLQ